MALFPWKRIFLAMASSYFTRSVVRPPGFYRALHTRSSLDADSLETTRGLVCLFERETDQEGVYEVERLVQRRTGKV